MSMGRFGRCGWVAALAGFGIAAATAQGAVLTHVGVSMLGTGGSGGSGTSASDMVYATYNGVDGWGWAGGAGAVQGNGAVTNTPGAHSAAANEVLRFDVGTTVDTLNATYGAGNWTVANAALSISTSSKTQNNSRFGVGSGNFDIYWVRNDNWAQSKGTLADRGLNPVYAANAAGLQAWSGSQSLLGSETFTMLPVGDTGHDSIVVLTFALSNTSPFVNDIVSATGVPGGNSGASLYLMGTSDSLGMIIYSGGQGAALPQLSFDVVSVPEPALVGAIALGTMAGLLRRRARRA